MEEKKQIRIGMLVYAITTLVFIFSFFIGILVGSYFKDNNNVEKVPNVVLAEKKANEDINADLVTIPQKFIVGGFIERIYTPSQRDNLYFLQSQVNSSFDIYNGYINGFTINVDIWLSGTLRYDTESIFEPDFNDATKQSFDIPIDLEIDLDTFTSIDFVSYISDYAIDEIEFICEIFINGNLYDDIYLYYVPPFSITTITKTFNFLTNVTLINDKIVNDYSLGYEVGYYDGWDAGKLVGIDEGYNERDAEYESTDSAFTMIWQFISNAFASVFNVLNIQLFAGIKLFHILAIPLIISVLYFVIKILAK